MNIKNVKPKKLEFRKDKPNELTTAGKLHYAIYVLENNTFTPNEINYYKGKTLKKQPHGIPQYIWNEAIRRVGIKERK